MTDRKLRVIIFTVILIVVLLLLLKERQPFGKGNSDFAVGEESEITRIELSGKDNRLILENKGGEWFVNDGKETRKTGILFILRILREIRIKSPVSDDLFRQEITGRGVVPVKVKVFEKKKPVKSFLVYKTGSNIYGNIMKMRETSKPFIVHVPGYEGDIASAFTLNDLFWQTYTVFSYLPSEIESVSFENLRDTASSFSVLRKNGKFLLFARDRELKGWDSARLTRYLSYFTRIPFEEWAPDMGTEEKRKIEAGQPVYTISLTTNTGSGTVVQLWEREAITGGIRSVDTDRLWAKSSLNDNLFIVRYFDIDPVLKKRSYFFPD